MYKFLIKNSIQDDKNFISEEDVGGTIPNYWIGNNGWKEIFINKIPNIYNFIKNSSYKQELYNMFKEESINKNWELNYDVDKTIIIHVRLLDEAPLELSNIQRNTWANGNHYVPKRFIGKDNLLRLIIKLNTMYPYHNISLLTAPNEIDIKICNDIIKNTKINCNIITKIQEDKYLYFNNKLSSLICGDEDYDTWKMINCDILVLSASTFPFLAAYLHNGSKIYIPENDYKRFEHFKDFGFNEDLILKY
jgi:hypothetical protein